MAPRSLPIVALMHPTQVAKPEGWVYEEKVDGYRVLAHKAGDRVRLMSRHAKESLNRSLA